MSEQAQLNLDDYVDGVITSLPPGTEGATTFFTTSPYQTIGCDGGFSIQFAGPQFTHKHPRVVELLRRLAKRNVGIFEAAPAALAEAAETAKAESQALLEAGKSVDTAAQAKTAGTQIATNQAAGK